MKYLILDAGPLISLAMNGMLYVIEKLKEGFAGEFIITPGVKSEVIDRPIKIKKYSLEAIRVKDLWDRGVIKLSSKIIPNSQLDKETKRIIEATNSFLRSSKTGEKINLIHKGEAECLAFAKLCGVENVIAIDERTTRMLIESPENLKTMMEKKLHIPLKQDLRATKDIRDLKFIRSAELLFVAYKKGLVGIGKDPQVLDAMLYGVKFKGTAISSKEIEEMKRLV